MCDCHRSSEVTFLPQSSSLFLHLACIYSYTTTSCNLLHTGPLCGPKALSFPMMDKDKGRSVQHYSHRHGYEHTVTIKSLTVRVRVVPSGAHDSCVVVRFVWGTYGVHVGMNEAIIMWNPRSWHKRYSGHLLHQVDITELPWTCNFYAIKARRAMLLYDFVLGISSQ